MKKIEWKESYSLDIPEIDSQHRKIVDLINEISATIEKKSEPQNINNIIDSLYNYTLTHFSHEESLMKNHNYFAYDAHKREHEKFTAQVNNIHKRYKNEEPELAIEILNMLSKWLIDHILALDKLYVPSLKETI